MDPSIRQIRYFVEVVNAGQISRASRGLDVSQSTVTTVIRELETAIGCSLFRRNSRGVTLMHDGAIFLQHAGRVFAAVDEAVRAPRKIRNSLEGKLKLATTYMVA